MTSYDVLTQQIPFILTVLILMSNFKFSCSVELSTKKLYNLGALLYSNQSMQLYLLLLANRNKRDYRKVPKFSDHRKLCCNLQKIQTKSPNLRVFCQKDANSKQ